MGEQELSGFWQLLCLSPLGGSDQWAGTDAGGTLNVIALFQARSTRTLSPAAAGEVLQLWGRSKK